MALIAVTSVLRSATVTAQTQEALKLSAPAAVAEAPAPLPVPLRPPGTILALEYRGPINPVSLRYFKRAIRQARNIQAQALLLHLDTAGGMLSSAVEMIKEIKKASFPVVIFISPQGAKAVAPGALLLLAADVAAMTRDSSLGGAGFVDSKGEALNDEEFKVLVDDLKYLASEHGRATSWAEKIATAPNPMGAAEARRRGLVDVIVPNREALLAWMHGRVVNTHGQTQRFNIQKASVLEFEMSWSERFLWMIAVPNVAYLLFLCGVMVLLLETQSSGMSLRALLGVLAVGLSYLSFNGLPVNYGALALLVFGISLIFLEAITSAGGILALGGAVVMFFGSFLLFGTGGDLYQVSVFAIAGMVAVALVLFLLVLKDTFKLLKRRAVQDTAALLGQHATCIVSVEPLGKVHIDGEDWFARCVEGGVKKGETVKVIGFSRLSLVVEALLPAEKDKEKKDKEKRKEKEEKG